MIFIGPVSCIVFSLLTFCLYALTLKQIRTWPLDCWLWGPSLDCVVPFLEFIFWWLSWACWKCCLLGKKRQVGKLSWTHLISDGGLFYTWILFSQDMWKQHSGMKHTLSKCIIIRVKNNVLICSPKVCFLSVTVIGNTECTTLSSLNHNSCQVVVLGCHFHISLWLWVESSYQQRSLWEHLFCLVSGQKFCNFWSTCVLLNNRMGSIRLMVNSRATELLSIISKATVGLFSGSFLIFDASGGERFLRLRKGCQKVPTGWYLYCKWTQKFTRSVVSLYAAPKFASLNIP